MFDFSNKMSDNKTMSLSEEITTGDIILVKGNQFPISNLIRLVTGSPYTHIGLAIDHETIFEVDAFERLKKRAIRHDDYIVLRLKNNLSSKQKLLLKQYMRQMEANSKGYDWRMIFSVLIQRVFKIPLRIEDPHRYICSEVVDNLYLSLGIDLIKDRDAYVTPDEFISSDLLETIR